MSDRFRGYVLGVLAAASYGTNPVFAVPLYDRGMDTASVLFWRYVLAVPILLALVARSCPRILPKGRELPLTALMGALMSFSSLFLFLSYVYMDAGIASTILFVYPLLVSLLMLVFFRERLSLWTRLAMLLSFVGVVLMYDSASSGTVSMTGCAMSLLSALCYATYIVLVNHSPLRTLPAVQSTLCVVLTGTLIFTANVLLGDGLSVPKDLLSWCMILGLATFPTVISFFCTTGAIRLIGSTRSAVLGVFEPLTAILLGVAVLGETLSLRQVLGIILVLGSVQAVIVLADFPKIFRRMTRSKQA